MPSQPKPQTSSSSKPAFRIPNPKLKDSPIKRNSRYGSRSLQSAAVSRPRVKETRTGIRLSMDGKTVMVPVAYMLRKFVPTPSDEDEPTDDAAFTIDFSQVPNKGPESGMYNPLVCGVARPL